MRGMIWALAGLSLCGKCACARAPTLDGPVAVPASSAPLREGDDEGWRPPPLPPASNAPRAPDRLLVEARRELSAVRSTRYRHHTRVDEATGTFEYDCSGFVAYALSRADPEALLAIPPGPKGRPRAEDFVAYFRDLPPASAHWLRVERWNDVAAGDVVAWLKPAEIESTNTGHMAVVLERVGLSSASSAVAALGGVRELLLRVIDSTESPHARDTRSGDERTGLGTGVIGLIVDGDDAPIGYRWRGGRSPRAFATTIVVARVR